MAIQTGNDALDIIINRQLLRLASQEISDAKLLNTAPFLKEAVFHDFTNCVFLADPDDPIPSKTTLESFVQEIMPVIEAVVIDWSEGHRDESYIAAAREGFVSTLAEPLYFTFLQNGAPQSFIRRVKASVESWLRQTLDTYQRDNEQADRRFLSSSALWINGVDRVFALLEGDGFMINPDTRAGFDREMSLYGFEPFRAGSINFGLQVVYRQNWSPLGAQPGEIIRTIPLGPKQSEKISIKAIRRTTSTRQAEISTSVEIATESSAATKDSSEVVQEASESHKWNAKGSANFGINLGIVSFGGGGGGGGSGEDASSSRDTKSYVNDTMEKTASKIRKDTKIIVSSETETTSEFSRTSEIVNPNDEVAVTYIYSRLQRQYEIQTYLSEVNRVIYVAERVPAPSEINGEWIRRHDWIIAQVLLDDSFSSDLDVIRTTEPGIASDESIDSNIESMMEGLASSGIPDVGELSGQIPDLYRTPQEAYEREVERRRVRKNDQQRYLRSVRRVRQHIADNILHYCQAIWNSESPDARYLRYRKMSAPAKWFYQEGENGSSGVFRPSVEPNDQVPLTELINTATPIGHIGNYAMFYLRESVKWESLSDMLRLMQMPYAGIEAEIEYRIRDEQGLGLALSGRTVKTAPGNYDYVVRANGFGRNSLIEASAVVSDNIEGVSNLAFILKGGKFEVGEQLADNDWRRLDRINIEDNVPFEIRGIRVTVKGVDNFKNGDGFYLSLVPTQELEDPELKALRWSVPQISRQKAPNFFKPSTVNAMREYFTDVWLAYSENPDNVGWDDSTPTQQKLLLERYHDYLLRVRHTRRLVVDTNNVFLTREVDSASTLEPFKGLHRVLDVLNSGEQLATAGLHNDRLNERLANNLLGDPDIERLTYIGTDPSLAALDALNGEPEDEERDEG